MKFSGSTGDDIKLYHTAIEELPAAGSLTENLAPGEPGKG